MLALKNVFKGRQTFMFQVSNFEVSRPNLSLQYVTQTSMFQVSNFEVFLPKSEVLSAESVLSWFTQFTVIAVWGKPAKITDMERRKSIEDYIWVGKLQSLPPEK